MRGSIIRSGVIVLAITAVVGGTAILISDMPLRQLCRTDCWLNDLLFAMFGETRGKPALAILWCAAAVLLATLALRMRKPQTSAHRKQRITTARQVDRYCEHVNFLSRLSLRRNTLACEAGPDTVSTPIESAAMRWRSDTAMPSPDWPAGLMRSERAACFAGTKSRLTRASRKIKTCWIYPALRVLTPTLLDSSRSSDN